MAHTCTPSRADCLPSERFNRRLHMYSVAAGATGVGLLALAQPAQGEIVYTPTNITISTQGLHSYALDLSGDGTTDFFISAISRESNDTSGRTSRIIARPAQGNGVVGYGGNAAALQTGQPVGIGRKFKGSMMASLHTFIGSEFTFRGQWVNAKGRYLGLEFQIDGQTHYGWARLSVVGHVKGKTMTAVLTGYAYETIANASINAGQTSGGAEASLAPTGVPAFQTDAPPATLGALALGAPALSIWRRRQRPQLSVPTGT
jgi:hypothetical protein